MARCANRLTDRGASSSRLAWLAGRIFAAAIVLGIALGLLSGLLHIEPSFATGYSELRCAHPSVAVVFVDASTDDPPGTIDPGHDRDVASCRAKVQRGRAFVSIQTGYPNYTCTFSVTIHNRGNLPVRLGSLEIQHPPALAVAEVDGLPDLVIQPGQRAVQSFSVRVEQEAEPGDAYRFRIREYFWPK